MRPAHRIPLAALALALAAALACARAGSPGENAALAARSGPAAAPLEGETSLEGSSATARREGFAIDRGSSAQRGGEPRPPGVALLAPAAPAGLLRIHPSEPAGSLVIAGTDGTVFARVAIAGGFEPARRAFDLALALPAGEDSVLLAHESPEGRRSPWCRVDLAGSPGGSCENVEEGLR